MSHNIAINVRLDTVLQQCKSTASNLTLMGKVSLCQPCCFLASDPLCNYRVETLATVGSVFIATKITAISTDHKNRHARIFDLYPHVIKKTRVIILI